MAKNVKKIRIKDSDDSGFGNYNEEKGGGSPKGGKFGGKNGRVGWSQRESDGEVNSGEHRESQPRTEDGKFTYNSVNGKSRKYDYHGEYDTVNPLLTGGVNGVKAEDVKKDFRNKSGAYWDKYKDKWYVKGSEKTEFYASSHQKAKWHVTVAGETIWDVARRSFDTVKGEFQGESKVFSGKPGAPSKEAKAAIQKSKATNSEQFVLDPKTGGAIRNAQPVSKQGLQPRVTIKPGAPTTISPVRPTVGNGNQPAAQQPQQTAVSGGTSQTANVNSVSGKLKHTKEEIRAVREAAKELFPDTDFDEYSDEQLDAIIDDYFDFSEDEPETEEETSNSSAPAPEEETSNNSAPKKEEDEESETNKKLAKLGFSE